MTALGTTNGGRTGLIVGSVLLISVLFGSILVPAVGALSMMSHGPAETITTVALSPQAQSRVASHDRSVTWSLDTPTDYTVSNIDIAGGNARLAAGGGTGWSKKADSAIGRNGHGMTFDRTNGIMYTSTGHDTGFAHVATTWSYNPSTGTWTQKANLPATGRMLVGMGFDSTTGKVYLHGGYDGSFTDCATSGCFDDQWEYNTGTNLWTQKANLPKPMHSTSMFYDSAASRFLVWAGCVNSFYSYTPGTDAWAPLPFGTGSMYCPATPSTGAGYSQAAFDPAGRKMYVFGGLQSSTVAYKSLWIYDAALNSWSSGANPLTARYDGAAFFDEARGLLTTIGGYDEFAAYPAPATYDPVLDSWSSQSKPAGMEDRYFPYAVYDNVNGRGIYFGGWGPTTSFLKDVWWSGPTLSASGFLTGKGTLEDNFAKVTAVNWNATTPVGTTLKVELRSSADGLTGWSSWEQVAQAGNVADPDGVLKHVEVRATLTGDGSSSPVVQDITLDYKVNQAPTVDAGADVTANKGDAVALTATATDPDTDTLTYRWTQVTGTALTLGGSTTATATVTPLKSGAYSFKVVVTDPLGVTAQDEVALTVGNRAPTVTAGPDQTVTKGATVVLNAVGTDADAPDTLTYSWVQTGGPTIALTGASTSGASFLAGSAGVVEVAVTVTDGEATSAPAPVKVTVGSKVPTADLSADVKEILTGGTILFDATESADPDGTIVGYWYDFGDGSNSDWVTDTSLEHVYTKAGAFTATVKVKDSDGVESPISEGVAITVNLPNQVPTVAPTVSPAEGDTLTEFVFTANEKDSDGQVTEVTWTIGTKTKTGPVVKYTFDTPDDYVVKVVAKDNGGLTAMATLTVTVKGVAPTGALKVTTPAPIAGAPVVFDASGSKDADGSVKSYTIDFGDGTSPVTVTTPTTSHTYATAGTYTATVTVKDDDGLMSAPAPEATVSVVVAKAKKTVGGGSGGVSMGLLGAIIALAAVGGLVAVMMMRRKKSGGSPPTPPPQMPPAAPPPPPPPPGYGGYQGAPSYPQPQQPPYDQQAMYQQPYQQPYEQYQQPQQGYGAPPPPPTY